MARGYGSKHLVLDILGDKMDKSLILVNSESTRASVVEFSNSLILTNEHGYSFKKTCLNVSSKLVIFSHCVYNPQHVKSRILKCTIRRFGRICGTKG